MWIFTLVFLLGALSSGGIGYALYLAGESQYQVFAVLTLGLTYMFAIGVLDWVRCRKWAKGSK